jgi:polar amino acid transport system substrate-binding protein
MSLMYLMRPMRRRLLAAPLALLSGLPQAAESAPLRLAVAELPPYAMSHATAAGPGSLVEITQELLRRLGAPLTLEFYPWQRALTMAMHVPRMLVLPLTRTPEREPQYRWMVRLYRQRFIFVGAHGGGVDVHDAQALARKRLVVLRGSPHKRALLDAGFIDVSECSTVRECMRMVKKGIADATYGGEDIHRYAATLDGNKESDYDFSAMFRDGEVWLAGSLDLTEEDGRKWRAEMEAMRADGTVARILRKYGASGN